MIEHILAVIGGVVIIVVLGALLLALLFAKYAGWGES
jgi:hypothetical protein